ncbi:Fc.00g020780.m01.CDS01 [Cosmosporella sp. VM-42]
MPAPRPAPVREHHNEGQLERYHAPPAPPPPKDQAFEPTPIDPAIEQIHGWLGQVPVWKPPINLTPHLRVRELQFMTMVKSEEDGELRPRPTLRTIEFNLGDQNGNDQDGNRTSSGIYMKTGFSLDHISSLPDCQDMSEGTKDAMWPGVPRSFRDMPVPWVEEDDPFALASTINEPNEGDEKGKPKTGKISEDSPSSSASTAKEPDIRDQKGKRKIKNISNDNSSISPPKTKEPNLGDQTGTRKISKISEDNPSAPASTDASSLVPMPLQPQSAGSSFGGLPPPQTEPGSRPHAGMPPPKPSSGSPRPNPQEEANLRFEHFREAFKRAGVFGRLGLSEKLMPLPSSQEPEFRQHPPTALQDVPLRWYYSDGIPTTIYDVYNSVISHFTRNGYMGIYLASLAVVLNHGGKEKIYLLEQDLQLQKYLEYARPIGAVTFYVELTRPEDSEEDSEEEDGGYKEEDGIIEEVGIQEEDVVKEEPGIKKEDDSEKEDNEEQQEEEVDEDEKEFRLHGSERRWF